MSINIPNAHRANVSLPYGELKNIVAWCETNCTGDWRFIESTTKDGDTIYDRDDQYFDFLFESDRDYTAFILWKK